MEEKYLCGVKINNISKKELLEEVSNLIDQKKHSYVVTPYSEFVVTAQWDHEFREVLNDSDISIADGIGILMGFKYLSLPDGKYKAMFRCITALFRNRLFFYDQVKAKLSGSEIVYDVAEMAAEKGYKIFLLGGFDFGQGNTGILTKQKLEKLYPNIQIVGHYSGSANETEEEEIVKLVNDANPDILFVAYGPVSQEKWMFRNSRKLKPMVAFGLGGTFDYISGVKKKVPKFLSDRGLEGILRPFYSEGLHPKRIYKRIRRGWVGIVKFILLLMRSYKRSNINNSKSD